MGKVTVGLLTWVLVLAVLCGGAGAAVLRVDSAATGSPADGLTWETAFPTVQAALTAAAPNDELWITAGIYTPGVGGDDIDTTSFILDKNLSLYGGFVTGALSRDDRNPALNETILSGDLARNDDVDTSQSENSCHVVQVNGVATSVVLDGLSVTGGYAFGGNYGVEINGGGIFAHEGTTCTLQNCRVASNTVMCIGAGVYALGASLVLRDCHFDVNSAGTGGGVAVNAGSLDAKRCVFSGNMGMGGAAYVTADAGSSFENCVFADNWQWGGGGAIYNHSGAAMQILNCTFSGNAGTDPGGALYLSATPTTIENSIFWNNSPDEIYNLDSVYTVTHSIVQGGHTGEGNLSDDPLLRLPKAPWPYELSGGSPAIDSASSCAPAVDAEGAARPQNGGPDMGAYEFHTDSDNQGFGLPDDYETANDLNPADPMDDAIDSDEDGLNNMEEFRRYTNPQDPDDPATDYYADATAGSDDTGDGTAALPWLTVGHAMQSVQEGTPTFQVVIHLAAGTYTEMQTVAFRHYTSIVGAGSDTTIIEYYGEGAIEEEVVTAAEGCRLEDCTVRFAQTVTAYGIPTHLLRIEDVNMFVQHVVFDGMDSPYAIGVFVTGTGSSGSELRNSTIKRVKYGVWAVDSGINVTRNVFTEILALDDGAAIFIDPPAGKADAAAPMLGSKDTAGTTGLNTFLMDSGYFVVNRAGGATSAQYNYWGPYTDAEIDARMSSGSGGKAGSNVTFRPYVGQSLIGAGLVVAVNSDVTNDAIDNSYQPKAAIGSTSPSRDAPSSLFIFMGLSGTQRVDVSANGFTGQSRNVKVVAGDTIVETFTLAYTGGEGEGEGENQGCHHSAGTLSTPSMPRGGDGLMQLGVIAALVIVGRISARTRRTFKTTL